MLYRTNDRPRVNSLRHAIESLWTGGFFSILTSGTLSKMTAFLTSVVTVRLMSKGEYASLAYADNIYGYVTLVAGLGMASAVLKYCVGENEEKNRNYYRFSFVWGSVFQILVVSCVLIGCSIIRVPFNNTRLLIIALAPYGFFYYWVALFQSFLRTRFENNAYSLSSLIQSVAALILAIILVPQMGNYGVAVARVLSMILSILVFWNIAYLYFHDAKINVLKKEEILPFIELAVSLLISNLFSMMMPMNEAFIVNNVIADEVTSANYRVANLIPSQLPFVTTVINVYFFPSIAKMEPGPEAWRRIVKIGIGSGLLVLAVSVVGFIANPLIISAIYGESYSDSVSLAGPLWFVYCANAGFRMIPMNMIPALGFARFNAVAAAVTGLLHLGLCFFAISLFGINGGIFIRFMVNIASGFAYWVYLRKVCQG